MTGTSPVILPTPRIRALLDGRMTQLRMLGADLQPGAGIAPGHLLWVKENWRTWDRHDGLIPSRIPRDAAIFFDTDAWPYEMRKPGRRRRALDMCKRMSRLTLKVTAVRVERLQDISAADALAEGACGSCRNLDTGEETSDDNAALMNFAGLWDNIHAARGQGWHTNPWVAALTVQTIHANIGEIREHAA